MPNWKPSTDEEIEAQSLKAHEAARLREEKGVYATSARYDRVADRVVIELKNGITLMFPPHLAQGLAGASPEELEDVTISPAGWTVDWKKLGAGFTVDGLLAGIFGGEKWMAQHFGRKGGQVRSEAKTKAVRENGKKGGRPRKAL